MTLIIKTTVFWDAMPCSLEDRYKYFEGTCHLQLQSRKSFHPEDRGSKFLQNMVPMY
jgi:hypothetical protein